MDKEASGTVDNSTVIFYVLGYVNLTSKLIYKNPRKYLKPVYVIVPRNVSLQ